jgi:hypothetical protein
LLEKDFQRLHDANKGEATDPRRWSNRTPEPKTWYNDHSS